MERPHFDICDRLVSRGAGKEENLPTARGPDVHAQLGLRRDHSTRDYLYGRQPGDPDAGNPDKP